MYTKGEWKADIRVGIACVYADNGEDWHCLNGLSKQCLYWADGNKVFNQDDTFSHWEVTPEQEANAHLIAAAPAMYEALKYIVDTYERNGTYDFVKAYWMKHGDFKRVLYKAEGKEVV